MYTFHKSEKLSSKKLIAKLFVKGNRGLSRFPFRFTWVPALLEAPGPAQVLFIVSKRNFSKATSRNKIKRQLRELYRLSKPMLYSCLGDNKQIALSIMYNAPVAISYQELANIFAVSIKQLCNDLDKNYTSPIHHSHSDI